MRKKAPKETNSFTWNSIAAMKDHEIEAEFGFKDLLGDDVDNSSDEEVIVRKIRNRGNELGQSMTKSQDEKFSRILAMHDRKMNVGYEVANKNKRVL